MTICALDYGFTVPLSFELRVLFRRSCLFRLFITVSHFCYHVVYNLIGYQVTNLICAELIIL